MKPNHYLIAAMTAMATFTSCSEEENLENNDKAFLQVSTEVPELTRAPIDGTELSDGAEIGVSVFNPDGTDYTGEKTFNVLYTKQNSWTSQIPITLTTSTGKAIAYYPYSETVSDITAIPVETDSQTDYLYSDWVEDLAFDNSKANFILNHALCVIQINLANEGYAYGPGKVTKIAVSSPALAKAATLNAQTGELSGLSGIGEAITIAKAFTLTETPQSTKILAVPTNTQNDLTVKVWVDGAISTVIVPISTPLVQGKAYIANFKIKDEPWPVKFSSISVKELNR